MQQRSAVIGLCGLTVVLVGVALVFAGPLDPPVGPVAPTYRTLDEVEPRINVNALPGDLVGEHVITEDGSYYLTGNINVPADRTGIRILNGSDVTIDLNGFAIIGSDTGDTPVGITGSGQVTVRNGQMIFLRGGAVSLGSQSLLKDLCIELSGLSSGGPAAVELGRGSILRDSTFRQNGLILLADSSSMSGCVVRDSFPAVSGGDDVSVTDCIFDGLNQSTALPALVELGNNARVESTTFADENSTALVCLNDALVVNCSATHNRTVSNGASGFVFGARATVRGCTLHFYPADCVSVGNASVIESNNITSAGDAGIDARASAVIRHNSVLDCDTGIATFGGAVIHDNSVDGSVTLGINADFGASVIGNALRFGNVGIAASGDSLIKDNTLDSCAISITGSDNRIEGNAVADITPAIIVQTTGNLIIRNSSSNSASGFDIIGGNTVGPIISGGGTITTSNPWANFGF